jgi:hypothetical protein
VKGIFNAIAFGLVATCGVIFTAFLGLVLVAPWVFFIFYDAAARAEKASSIVKTTLMQGEELIAQAIQFRIFGLFHRREVVAITSSRIMIVRRGLIGGFKMKDIQWKDLKDVTIEQNVLESICGSNLNFRHLNLGVPAMSVDGVPSDVASLIYSRAQSEEQAWEEKRRVRAMEEVRAAAGGVVVNTHQPQPSAPQSSGGSRMLAEIQDAKKLLDSGTISDAEFQEMKSKILASS